MINKNFLEIVSIKKTELKNIESLLVKVSFELHEIWTPDEDNEVRVWSNKKLKKSIQVIITENNPIEDNTTKVVNELVDLWFELRAIRNAVEYSDDDYFYNNDMEPTAYEKFKSKFEEMETEWNNEENHWNKIFKDNIDPSVLAYLYLDDDDKLLLTN
jgi:hypothetical protein